MPQRMKHLEASCILRLVTSSSIFEGQLPPLLVSSHGLLSDSGSSSVLLIRNYDYIGSTWVMQDKQPHLKSLTCLYSAKFF